MTSTDEMKWIEQTTMLRSIADDNRELAATLGDPIEAAEFDVRRNRKTRRQMVEKVNETERALQAIEDRLFGEGESSQEARLLKDISQRQTVKSVVYPKAAEFRRQLIVQADRIDGLLERIEVGLKDD